VKISARKFPRKFLLGNFSKKNNFVIFKEIEKIIFSVEKKKDLKKLKKHLVFLNSQ